MISARLPQEVWPNIPSSSQIQWACYKMCKVEWEAKTGMSQCLTSISDDFHRVHAGVKGVEENDQQPSQVACISKIWSAEDLETLPVGTKPRTSHTTDHLEKRNIEWGSAWWAVVNQINIGIVSKAMIGKLLRDGVESISMDFTEQVGTILSWTQKKEKKKRRSCNSWYF